MAFVKVLVPRTSQPQDACGIDRSNPLTTDLVYSLAGWDAGKLITSSAYLNGVGVNGAEIGVVTSSYSAHPTLLRDLSSAQSSGQAARSYFVFFKRVSGATAAPAIFAEVTAGGYARNMFYYNGGWVWRTRDTLSGDTGSAKELLLTAPIAGAYEKRLFTHAVGRKTAYINGKIDAQTTTSVAAFTTTDAAGFSLNGAYLNDNINGYGSDSRIQLFVAWNRELSATEAKSLSDNPWQIFEPEEQWVWIPNAVTAGGDPTGTLSATESGTDTLAGSGQIVVQGSASATESGTDTAALAGHVVVTGALSAAESGVDTLAATGGAVVTIAGAVAVTEASVDALAVVGQVIVQGAVAATELGTDTLLANGSSQIITTGYASATEAADDTLQSTGSVLVQGLLDAAEAGGDTAYLAGQIYVIGAAAATESGADTFAAIGSGAGVAYWPTPDQVLAGVSYGPTGADYTGTATAGSYPTAADIAAAVRADLTAELAQLTKVSKLHGIGVDLVVTPTSRTAGPLSQTISTAGTTVTVSAT